jgi:hypothetical protein
MENIEQVNNFFFIKYTFWIIMSFIAVFLNKKIFPKLFIFLSFIIIFFLQDDNSDLLYYKFSFLESTYNADIGFIWLQLFLKSLPLDYEVSFDVLKLSSFFLLFLTPKKNRALIYVIFVSHFFFLAIFNNLRQGIACTLILIGLLNLFDGKKRGFIFLFLSPFFHLSSLSILVLIILMKKIRFINQAYNFIFLILSGFIYFIIIKFASELFHVYNEYFRGYDYEEYSTRTNPYLKQLLVFLYLVVMTELKYLKNNNLVSLLLKLRVTIFVMSSCALFLTGSDDLAGRILYYFYAFDALYCAYLIYNFKLSFLRKVIYFISVIFSPSVTAILNL